jgi:hypothetical protein
MNTSEYRKMMGLPKADKQERINLKTEGGQARYNALKNGIKEKVNKYRNKKLIIDGEAWDSEGEYNYWLTLKEKERNGEIRELKRQVAYTLQEADKEEGIRAIKYVADFEYWEIQQVYFNDIENVAGVWAKVVEDYKSEGTRKIATYAIKKKLFRVKFPNILFREVIVQKIKVIK